jgi:fatty acid amide hydrolase 2
MIAQPLQTLSAVEIAEKIKCGEISSVEVVSYHIDQINKWNPSLNAVVETCFDQALEQAQLVDQEVQNKNSSILAKPLLGVPFTIKEMIAVQGMKSTKGSLPRKDRRSEYNAAITQKLLDAGAILLGTTNVPEVGFWYECDNVIYGKTNNPFALDRSSGGSTGGEAAIIAAGGSVFGVGSDIGGSIRMPAAFCGIYGHKPSEKIIPFTGHFPVSRENAKNMVGLKYPFTVLGPMARSAKDLYLLMQILSGKDGYDTQVRDFQLQPPITDWSQITVWSWPSPKFSLVSKTDPELSKIVLKVVEHFGKLGATIRELDPNLFKDAFEVWSGRALQRELDYANFRSYISDRGSFSYFKEFFKLAAGRRSYTFPALLSALFEDLTASPKSKARAVERMRKAQIKAMDFFPKNSLIVCPAHPRVAPKHGRTLRSPMDFVYTGIFNALNFPASVGPIGINPEGLPLSIQLAAPPDQDHICLSALQEIEKNIASRPLPKLPVE